MIRLNQFKFVHSKNSYLKHCLGNTQSFKFCEKMICFQMENKLRFTTADYKHNVEKQIERCQLDSDTYMEISRHLHLMEIESSWKCCNKEFSSIKDAYSHAVSHYTTTFCFNCGCWNDNIDSLTIHHDKTNLYCKSLKPARVDFSSWDLACYDQPNLSKYYPFVL